MMRHIYAIGTEGFMASQKKPIYYDEKVTAAVRIF